MRQSADFSAGGRHLSYGERLAREQWLAGEQLRHDATEQPGIHELIVVRLPQEHLGGHVRERAARCRRAHHGNGQPEDSYLHHALAVDKDVPGLDVSLDTSLPLLNRIPSDWSETRFRIRLECGQPVTTSPGDISSPILRSQCSIPSSSSPLPHPIPQIDHRFTGARGKAAAMAGQMLRRWNTFYVAFDAVDDAIEAADPGQFSRHVFRRARGDLVGQLCSAADDDEAERLCGILDDVMAESLETLRLVPEAPVSTELAESVRALREHDSERVRLLARGIVSGWEASIQDDVAEVTPATPMNKLENVAKVTPAMAIKKLPQSKAAIGQHQNVSANPNAETKRPPKIMGEPLAKKTVKIIKKPASDPASGFVDGDHAVLSWEDKMEAAKRKLRQGYQEAEDAKRRRRTQLVQAPKMMQPASQMQPIRRCTSSMAKKTISIRTQLH
ncbi:hypothetical protein ZWY2020_001532 [Hordeum vulgare]|nr:hypothetical protein ZWY2020_001532 [Hordeum vulgare]